MSFNLFPMRLMWTAQITPSVLHLAFRRDDGDSLVYTPGQFLNLHFSRDGAMTHRSYSLANTPSANGSLEIAVSPIEGGLATGVLFGLKPGETVQASGPYGRFVLRDDPPCRYVMVGTGTGITPYRSMLPEIAKRLQDGFSVDLLLGVRTRDELLYGNEFRAFAAEYDDFRFHACLSREEAEAPDERQGYVQHQFDALDVDPEKDVIYLCGNPDMVDDAVKYLKEREFPIGKLRREKYLPARR